MYILCLSSRHLCLSSLHHLWGTQHTPRYTEQTPPRVLNTMLGLVLSSDNTYPLRHTSVNILTKYLSILISCPNVSHSAQRYLVFVFLLLVQFYYNMFTVVAALKSAHGDIVCIRLNLHCKIFPISKDQLRRGYFHNPVTPYPWLLLCCEESSQ